MLIVLSEDNVNIITLLLFSAPHALQASTQTDIHTALHSFGEDTVRRSRDLVSKYFCTSSCLSQSLKRGEVPVSVVVVQRCFLFVHLLSNRGQPRHGRPSKAFFGRSSDSSASRWARVDFRFRESISKASRTCAQPLGVQRTITTWLGIREQCKRHNGSAKPTPNSDDECREP